MITRFFTRILTGLVRGYQLVVSPWFAPTCRYYPSCSQYAIDALRIHGPLKGTGLAGWRLLRCNPWSDGGVDHVPPRSRTADSQEPESTFESSIARLTASKFQAVDLSSRSTNGLV